MAWTPKTIRRLAAGAAATAALAAVPAAPASAGLLDAGCTGQPLSQPFLQFVDPFQYTLAPSGNFENGAAGWSLSGGAKVVSGNEPWKVGGSAQASSLLLPAGSSATSPAMCAGLLHPTARLFARRTSGGLLSLSTLAVELLYDGGGLVKSAPLGVVTGGTSWAPSLPFVTLAGLPLVTADGRARIAFRLTPLGGSWQVDDLYVDPYRRI
jgi:hypothetical protein